MDIFEALKIVKQMHPDKKPIRCSETTNFFEFGLGDSNGNIIANGCTFLVEKDKKIGHWYRRNLADLLEGKGSDYDFGELLRRYDEDELEKLSKKLSVSKAS